jgi:hypothetical protein
MTVAELIAKLKTMPQDLQVHINDEGAGVLHEAIDAVFDIEEDADYGDAASVIIAVNSIG